ncbi:hypothetical protein ACFQZ4_18050 [Catellatospora coxensis]
MRDPEPVRPGSRADRLAMPIAREVLVAMAEHNGVCVRPWPSAAPTWKPA